MSHATGDGEKIRSEDVASKAPPRSLQFEIVEELSFYRFQTQSEMEE